MHPGPWFGQSEQELGLETVRMDPLPARLTTLEPSAGDCAQPKPISPTLTPQAAGPGARTRLGKLG